MSAALARQSPPRITKYFYIYILFIFISLQHWPDGRSRGWGIVRFDTPEDASAAAAAMNGVELGGRAIEVREDKGPTPRLMVSALKSSAYSVLAAAYASRNHALFLFAPYLRNRRAAPVEWQSALAEEDTLGWADWVPKARSCTPTRWVSTPRWGQGWAWVRLRDTPSSSHWCTVARRRGNCCSSSNTTTGRKSRTGRARRASALLLQC